MKLSSLRYSNIGVTISHQIWKLFTNIRFWIILFFILRLFNINAPIFDGHAWRQADGYSIARNFLEIDPNILYPRIDHAGNLSGIMGSEFPIMNYLVYLLYLIFGVNWWQGRLINLVVSSIGTWYFYRIIHNYINRKVAFTAALFLITSIWLAHSRKFMPDIFSASFVITGIYFGWRYLHDRKGLLNLIFFGLFCMTGLLSKLPSFVMTALLVPALFDKEIVFRRKVILAMTSIIVIIPVSVWYFYWAPKLTADYGYFYFYMGSSLSESFHYLINEWPNTLSRYYYDAMHFVGFGIYLIGIFLTITRRNKKMLIFLVSVFSFQLVYMIVAGESFVHLSYYIIPFVPAIAIFGAYAVSQIQKTWLKRLVIAIVLIEGITNQQHDFRIKESEIYKLRFEAVANEYTKRTDLIAINNEVSPTSLYFAHRKGWSINSSDTTQPSRFQKLSDKGCKLIIWDKHKSTKPVSMPYFEMISEDEHFAVFQPVPEGL